MFLKALGVKYLSRYKSYNAPWTVVLQGQAPVPEFHIEDFMVSVDRKITGKGVDALGQFQVFGTVNKTGFAEFEKRYTTGGQKPVISFNGNFTNAMLCGQWIIKGQGSGSFQMKIDGARPFSLNVDGMHEVVYIVFLKNNSRLHSVGLLPDPGSPHKRFFILNGKVLGEEKGVKEVALKFFFPDYPDQHYYLGTMVTDSLNRITIKGHMESHSDKEWFSKGRQSPFEIVELPHAPGPNLNMGLNANMPLQPAYLPAMGAPGPHFPQAPALVGGVPGFHGSPLQGPASAYGQPFQLPPFQTVLQGQPPSQFQQGKDAADQQRVNPYNLPGS